MRLLAAAIVLAFGLAACSGATLPSAFQNEANAQNASAAAGGEKSTAQVAFVIRIKRHKKRAHWVPSNTQSAKIVVGKETKIVNLTPHSPGCTGTATLSCSVKLVVPGGTQTFTVTLYDATNAQGHALAAGSIEKTLVRNKLNTLTLVVGGIVAALSLQLAQQYPPQDGTSQSIALNVGATDADGNAILLPGDFDNGPIKIADSDTAHTQLQTAGETAGSSITIAAPDTIVNVTYDGSTALSSATFTANVPADTSITPATANLTPLTSVSVDAANGSPAISQDLLGANLPVWVDNADGVEGPTIASSGLHLIRWPGGSLADNYDWGDNPSHTPILCNGAYANPDSTFDNFMTSIPSSIDVAITVNYGSDPTCSVPALISEATDWVTYAKNKGYGNAKYWTVGNEEYGSWETDLHNGTSKHNGATYASAVKGNGSTTGFYWQMKAANPSAKVGVVVGGPKFWSNWDNAVLSGANGAFDFVEYHYYAQQGSASGSGSGFAESDSYILGQGITDFVSSLKSLRTEMTSNGVPTSIPIYLGELNSIVTTAGKQTVSITNGLFAGMAVAETMKLSGVTMGSWWLAFGDCETGGNNSSSLYGWQKFGAYTLFSDGPTQFNNEGCPPYAIPEGTPFPDGRAYAILSQFVGSGSVVRNVTLGSNAQNIRAYADTLGSGYGVLLFNLNETSAETYDIQLNNVGSKSSFTATQTLYGKAQYDTTKGTGSASNPSGFETGSVTTSLGTVGATFQVTLPPWSMNLVKLVPAAAGPRR